MMAHVLAEKLVEKVKVLKSNPLYRVADVFYRRGWRYSDSHKKLLRGILSMVRY